MNIRRYFAPRPTLALIISGAAFAQSPAHAQRVDRAEHHEFVIDNFRTESGVVLPKARIVYGTYGHLNPARDNAVLLPSHYMATHHGYEWLIGPGRALDTTRLFLVATELFGNGHSSSPSNTPEPYHGPRFPVTTIRDNVDAVHRLLMDDLKITHLRAIIGFSMGAQQAFQWAVSYPDFADRVVATSGTAKTYGHGIVRLEGQIAALTADPTFADGNYTAPPRKGMEAFGMVWAAWLYSQEWWRRELWKASAPPGTTLEQYMQTFRANFLSAADANDMILQARTWERHDVGGTPGFDGDLTKALRSIRVPFLYMPSETDLYFPIGDARYEAQFMSTVSLVPIPSLWGHPAGAGASPEDRNFLNATISRFLDPAAAQSPEAASRAGVTRPFAALSFPPDTGSRCYWFVLENGDMKTGPTTGIIKARPSCAVPPHYHTAEEQLLIVRGNVSMGMQGMRDTVIGPGGFAMMPSKAPHWFSCTAQAECVMFVTFDRPYDIVWIKNKP